MGHFDNVFQFEKTFQKSTEIKAEGRSVIVSMDSKVFFVFLLLVAISHGLECYAGWENGDPVRVQCPAGFDLCATNTHEDGTARFCANSQWLQHHVGFKPRPQIGTCTEITNLRTGTKSNLCLCSDDLCNAM